MITKASILLIDDDSDSVVSLAKALKASGLDCEINAASKPDAFLTLFRSKRPNAVVMDLCLDENIGPKSGFDLLKTTAVEDPTCRIIVLTGYGTTEHGVKCLHLGASNFLEKPPDIDHLKALIVDGINLSNLRREYEKMQDKEESSIEHFIIGESGKTAALIKSVSYAARTSQPVLISGETGTGKGLCARVIHQFSNRSDRNFVRFQPSFVSPDLVNSELFGHIKGSFTGAARDRKGLLLEADGGTLFLDEIDQLPLETQVALLGVLQDKSFRPVGANKETVSDFRLICASNQDIEKCVQSGKIRKDFYHRISHLCIHIPPLRDRKGDIVPIASRVMEEAGNRDDLNVFEISEAAEAKLLSFDWPGNIRQLQAVVEGAAFKADFAGRTVVEPEDIVLNRSSVGDKDRTFHSLVEEYKLGLIKDALAEHGGNQVQAARSLGLDRTSMRRILARHQD